MARIFSVLAVVAVLLLVAAFVVGLWIGDFNAAAQRKRAAHTRLITIERQMRVAKIRTSPDLDEAQASLRAADEAFRTPRSRMTLHMLLGSAAALVAVLVNSITITYFIGTSRWCREVCETYQIHGGLAERSISLKRSTFPWALAGIASLLAMVALGAAADPSGANLARSAAFVVPHYVAAMIGLGIVVASFWVQAERIAANYSVIEEILAEVQRIRAARNLPVEESPAS